ncbi:ABC transporter permease subunit [Natronorubrum sp. JWXQ-INN-674]|uniref:ABC transporter permease subunit n=1 Tax=Natronorubrum halalkaliphilum TaxID=2691917 RepID=A0A6B0VRH2_9EURY|nr:ABC transporter permease [Natronorubrum halalkaliphilum]MXV63935.1 ABC transporter permease subunit [Natronorubrum halalkaliphilum]
MSALGSAFGWLERFCHNYGPKIGRSTIVIVLLALWLPIVLVVVMSFAADGVLSFPPDNLTLEWYFVFLENDAAISSVFTTMKVSLVATPITVALATMLSYGVSRYDFRGKSAIQGLVTLPIIVPLIVVGVALALFFGMINVGGGFWSVVAAHVVRTIPFAALIILPTFMTFDRSLEEASKDLGANELETFWNVTLPNIMPAIVAGGILAFTVSFNEFIYTYFVRGTGMETMPIYLWSRIQHNVTPEVNVLSVVFLVVAILLVLVAVLLTNISRLTMRS